MQIVYYFFTDTGEKYEVYAMNYTGSGFKKNTLAKLE